MGLCCAASNRHAGSVSARLRSNSIPILELEGATFRVGDRLVFRQTHWRVEKGQSWAVIGENGSGKSLFAEALRGTLPLTSGEVKWRHAVSSEAGADGVGLASFEARHAVLNGTVVQSRWNSIEADATMPVRDFLAYEQVMDVNPFEVTDVHAKAKPAYERKQGRAIGLFALKGLLDRAMIALSNGEHQRVQLARAWCRSSTLLVLDEPFQGLDVASRAQLTDVLGKVVLSRLPVLILSTRWDELPDWVTHVLHIERCQARESGRKADVLRCLRQPIQKTTRSSAGLRLPAADEAQTSNSPEPIIQLQNVTVGYGGKQVLRNLSWSIWRNESWALLGPNGSGKSTLLSLLLGDHPQSYSNSVRVFGNLRGEGQSIWELKRQIGWVSPELQIHFPEDLSCREVVASGFNEAAGVFERLSRGQCRATHEWLAALGFAERAADRFRSLSEGEQRLLLLARALVKRPKLLLLDEPCQGLDFRGRSDVNSTIERLLEQHRLTCVYVTHREGEIPGAIRRVMRLRDGRGYVETRGSKE